MCKILKKFIVASVLFSFVSVPSLATAQNYKGGYSSQQSEKKVDKAAKPVPKVFSSRVSSVQQAEKLDILYNDLFVSLWIYASTGFVYQKKLYEHMRPKKFQLSRYAKEFSGDLEDSMTNLNENYSNIKSDIENAQNEYIAIREGIREADYEVLDPLWEEKINSFREKADRYFKMQNKFLNTYRNLVAFILKQGGSYYYSTADDRVHFYKLSGYKYFGQSIDKLRKIGYEQRKLLKENTPANLDIKLQ